MKAIILCGGLGLRLGELTRSIPKPMLAVGSRPFIAHVLDHVCSVPMDGIILAAGFAWQALREYVGVSWKGVPVTYSVESSPMKTGGAIKLAMDQNDLNDALILNGDTLFRIDLQRFIANADATADTCLALRSVPDCSRYGRVFIEPTRKVVAFGEKGFAGPGLINGGIYIQRRDALEEFGNAPFSFETEYLARRHQRGHYLGYVHDAYFIDIGVVEDLERAKKEIRW